MTALDRLAGDRVRLTSIRDTDIDTIISWDDDVEFIRTLRSDPGYLRPQAVQREWWSERLKAKDEYHFGIRLNENDKLIGTFHIDGIEWHHRVAWFSIGIGEHDARGKGYGAEAPTLGMPGTKGHNDSADTRRYQRRHRLAHRFGQDVLSVLDTRIHLHRAAEPG